MNGSFAASSLLFKYVAFNTRVIYDLEHAINKLPDKEGWDEIKNIVNESIKSNEEHKQFVQRAKRYFDDMSKIQGNSL